jgi:scyllo-inositol 2-dehydrogenase (NADP+)
MKTLVVGLGVQGNKRILSAGKDLVATVDPFIDGANYKSVFDVPAKDYDLAILSVPDSEKFTIIEYLVKNQKHILVEKPLFFESLNSYQYIDRLIKENKVTVYTAYNHRFDSNIQLMKQSLNQGAIGTIYHADYYYGNGTVQLVKNSPWRDSGMGVIADLGSHLLDLDYFLFGSMNEEFILNRASSFESLSPDHAVFGTKNGGVRSVSMEVSLCEWKNSFRCNIYGQLGSLHVESLCKWGKASFTHRIRKMPSGIPFENTVSTLQADQTWGSEYEFFKSMVASSKSSNLNKDIYIFQTLSNLYRT